MSPEVLDYLKTAGSSSIPTLVFLSVTSTIAFGFSLPIFAISVKLDWHRGGWPTLSRIPSWAQVVCFLLLTLVMCAFILVGTTVLRIPSFLAHSSGNISIAKESRDRHLFPADLILVWSENLLIGIGDAIVIWRASVIFPDPYMLSLLLLLWTGSMGSTISMNILLSSYRNWLESSPQLSRLNEASNWLSLATNLMALVYIMFGFWKYRQSVKVLDLECPRSQHSPIKAALRTMLETGSVLCILQLLSSILQQLLDKGIIPFTFASNLGISILFRLMYSFGGIYPSLINALVHTQRIAII